MMSLRCLLGYHDNSQIPVGIEDRGPHPDGLQAIYIYRCSRCGYTDGELRYDWVKQYPDTVILPKGSGTFLYALLGSNPDTAANMLKLNPLLRWRIHEQLYQQFNKSEPYEDMMNRLNPERI